MKTDKECRRLSDVNQPVKTNRWGHYRKMQENIRELPTALQDFAFKPVGCPSNAEPSDIVRKFRRSFSVLTVSQQILNLALFVLHGNLVRRLWHHARDCQSAACTGTQQFE